MKTPRGMSSAAVVWGIAARTLMLIGRLPSTIIPSLVMPVLLTVAFAGAFSGLVLLEGHPADKAIDWFLPLYTIQGAAFSGVRVGMSVARDLSTGFYDRILLSPVSRVVILAGSLLAAALLGVVPLLFLTVVAVAGGASWHGGVAGYGTLMVSGVGMAVVASAWSVGLAVRFKTQQITPLMQTGVFLGTFVSTAQMPLSLLTGWLHTAAAVNPMSDVLALARQGFLGDVTWDVTGSGLLALAGLVGAFGLFAFRGMQKVVP